MRIQFLLAGVVLCLLSPMAFAQGESFGGDVEEIRAQIQALERKLEQRQRGSRTSDRVTEIGGGGPRSWQAAPQDPLIVRIYDLSDLFAVAPAYYARQAAELDEDQLIFDRSPGFAGGGMGGMGGMGGGFFAVPTTIETGRNSAPLHQFGSAGGGDQAGNLGEARTSLNDLLTAIKQTISPEEWKENGGRGTISRLGNNLMISTTERSHEQIENLFNLFRKRWGSLRTVSIDAHWLWLTEEQLTATLGNAAGNGGSLTAEDWEDLRAASRESERGGYHVALTCYNGQTVSAVSGQQRRFLRGVSPTEVATTAEGEPLYAYATHTGVLQDGSALQVTPLTTSGGKIVVLDVHTRVNRFDAADEIAPAKVAPKAVDGQAEVVRQLAAAVDRPVLSSYRLATTLRVPVDETVMIGGMTTGVDPQPDEPGLYLFIRLSVQELRDEEPEERSIGPETAPPPEMEDDGEVGKE